MERENIERLLNSKEPTKAQYRTEYNFLEWNIILSESVQEENINGNIRQFILIGNLGNKVYLENIIKVQSGWLA